MGNKLQKNFKQSWPKQIVHVVSCALVLRVVYLLLKVHIDDYISVSVNTAFVCVLIGLLQVWRRTGVAATAGSGEGLCLWARGVRAAALSGELVCHAP